MDDVPKAGPSILDAVTSGTARRAEILEALRQDPGAFCGAEFAHADLSGRDLAEIDFSGSDFFETGLHQANLKKAVLAGSDFTNADMRQAAMYKVDLSNAILQEADLLWADLSESDCRGADFRGAKLKEANLSGADLRGCDFSHADLTDANLSGADVTGAKFSFAQFSGANVTHIRYGRYRDLVGRYYGVRGIDSTYGNALFVRDAKDQDYIDTLHQAILDMPAGLLKSLEIILFRAWGLIDQGRSLMKVSMYASIIAMIYGVFYLCDMVLGWQIMDYSSSAQTWFTPFYYSVVTYTTLGFGDVTANSLLGEILVISEVIVGYFTLGLLLAILANTIARRS